MTVKLDQHNQPVEEKTCTHGVPLTTSCFACMEQSEGLPDVRGGKPWRKVADRTEEFLEKLPATPPQDEPVPQYDHDVNPTSIDGVIARLEYRTTPDRCGVMHPDHELFRDALVCMKNLKESVNALWKELAAYDNMK